MVELAMVTPPDSSRTAHEATHSPGVDLDALRANARVEVKRGCEQGTCGSCVVLVDGTLSEYAMKLEKQER